MGSPRRRGAARRDRPAVGVVADRAVSARVARVARLGVVGCVAVASALVGLRFDSALGLFDHRADENAARGYLERLYGEPFGILGNREVVAEALLRMPKDATYRVLVGPNLQVEREAVVLEQAPELLRFVLLPRTRTESASAPWVFCYGCDRSLLGAGFQVLADEGNGIMFGRMRP